MEAEVEVVEAEEEEEGGEARAVAEVAEKPPLTRCPNWLTTLYNISLSNTIIYFLELILSCIALSPAPEFHPTIACRDGRDWMAQRFPCYHTHHLKVKILKSS